MDELVEQFPEADWVDQDLLTRDLAGSLLAEEIAAERGRLDRLSRGEGGDDIVMSKADMERRLAAMIAVRDNVGQNTSGRRTF
ncbi:hypothetical protein [Rhodococcus sp. 14-2470-1a]|uniref:hypothetical protein n=1 Tax=Rhodococcus sp. 14-2470-1a TaxID=2023150 RepID=UPI000B9AD0F7|nr:hypothetical protein [Rhodococcus sp. 14-2470-1a]OZF45961.1 hypothetical protein CH292_21400 [Rhodococcus sp. 14-2470-1a]